MHAGARVDSAITIPARLLCIIIYHNIIQTNVSPKLVFLALLSLSQFI